MSSVIQKLANDLAVPVLKHGALDLIRNEDSKKIVEACPPRGILILGIEAFRVVNGKVIPAIDFIADYSELASRDWEVACSEARNSAELLLREANERVDLWFDFNLVQRPETGS